MASKYRSEIIVALLGAGLAFVQLFIDPSFSFPTLSFALVLDIALISLKSFIGECMDSNDRCRRLIGDIADARWAADAHQMHERVIRQLEKMSGGIRDIPAAEVNNQEMALMALAEKSISCTYLADNVIKLRMRLPQGPANPLGTILNGYKDMDHSGVRKRRVIVLNGIDFSAPSNRRLLREVDEFCSSPKVAGGIGFEMRYVLLSKMTEQQLMYRGNLLLVDEREATLVQDKTSYADGYLEGGVNTVRDLVCTGVIDPVELKELERMFSAIWNASLPVERFLARWEE